MKREEVLELKKLLYRIHYNCENYNADNFPVNETHDAALEAVALLSAALKT